MNPQMPLHTQQETSTYALMLLRETEMLAGWGLRQWYQNGGSDRASLVRHLEFLRLLVRHGELEL